MKKNKNTNVEPLTSSPLEGGYLLQDHQISNLVGKMLTLIESLGLKDTQEKATKDIARDFLHSLYQCTYFPGDAVKSAFDKRDEIYGKDNRLLLGNVPYRG